MREEGNGMIWCFIGGVFAGTFLGLMIAALMLAASRCDHHDE